MALHLLVNKTDNDESKFIEQTPFETLQELKQDGYLEGLSQKQREVDELNAEKEKIVYKNAIQNQNNLISCLESNIENICIHIEKNNLELQYLEQGISELKIKQTKANDYSNRVKIVLKIVCSLLLLSTIWIAYTWLNSDDSWMWKVLTYSVGVMWLCISLFKEKKVVFLDKFLKLLDIIESKAYIKYNYDYDLLSAKELQYSQISEKNERLNIEKERTLQQLNVEKQKVAELSDMSLIAK